MGLGQFVISQIGMFIALFSEQERKCFALQVITYSYADENMRALTISQTVVEFRDIPVANNIMAESLERSRFLRNGYCKQGLLTLSIHSPFSDIPQPLKIHVGAGIDCDQSLPADHVIGNIFIQPRNRQSPCRLDNRPGFFEYLLDGTADRVGIDPDYLIDITLAKLEGSTTNITDRDAVSEDADIFQRDRVTSFK